MKSIKILSVGGGWVCNSRHIPALKQSGLFDVIGVVSNDPVRAKATAEKHGLPNYSTELDLAKGWQAEAQAVMIGTIPHAHAAIAKAALGAGKHVLTEKPMVLDPRDATELQTIARQNGCTLAVVHNFQFARCAQRLKAAIRDDSIGAVKSIYGVQLCNHQRNIPEWCDQLPLGLFYDEAPHFYYLFRWLAQGEMQLLHASVWDDPRPARHTPRMITAEYRSSKGIPVTLHINFESSITEWHVVVVGEKATVVMDVWRDIYIRLPNDGVHSASQIMQTSLSASWQHWLGVLTGGIRYMRGRHLYGNDEVVRRFYRAIQGEDSLQGMDADEGRRVIELMHEVVAKAEHF